jgi:hypothetical protein
VFAVTLLLTAAHKLDILGVIRAEELDEVLGVIRIGP